MGTYYVQSNILQSSPTVYLTYAHICYMAFRGNFFLPPLNGKFNIIILHGEMNCTYVSPAIAKSYYTPLLLRVHKHALKCGSITNKHRRFLLFVYKLGLVYSIPYLIQDQAQCQQFPCWPYRAHSVDENACGM